MKKKVMFLVKDKGYGGIEREVLTLANSLVSLYDITLFFVNDINQNLVIDKKINVILYDKNFFELKGNYYNKLFSNQDVVISTNIEFNKYLYNYNGKKIFWEHNHHDNKIINEYYLSHMEIFDYVVVPNKELEKIYLKVNKNVVIISNAIEIKQDSSELTSNNIIFIGKLVKEKRVDDLLDVVRMVNTKIKVNLKIVGEGNEKVYLESLVKRYNLKNVKFLGALNAEELDTELKDSSLFVTCSEAESFGVSILESMCMGIPVVAFDDATSLKNVIIDDINGYLISDRNKEEMVQKIILLLNDKEKRTDFGNCSKEKVLEYDINSLKREWIKII